MPEQIHDSNELDSFLSDKLEALTTPPDDLGDSKTPPVSGNQTLDPDDPSDELEASEADADENHEDENEEEAPPAPTERMSKIIKKLATREREATQLRKRVRELEDKQNKTSEPLDFADRIGFVRNTIAREMGVAADDARVEAELQELVQDLVLEMAGDAADKDPELKARRDRSREEAKRRKQDRALEDRITRIEREKLEAQATAMRSNALTAISSQITKLSADVPFLLAQDEENPAEMILELISAEQARGYYRITTEEEGVKAVNSAAKRLDEIYRQQAGRLASVLQKTDTGSVEKQKPGTKTKKRGSYTATDKAASGANRAVKKTQQDEDESFEDFVARRGREAR